MFLLLQYCSTYGQLLELKLLAFLSGTLHILLFISAYCANKMMMMMMKSWFSCNVQSDSIYSNVHCKWPDSPYIYNITP